VLDALLAPALGFEELPDALPALFGADSDVICQPIRYAGTDENR
jgi:hypothetical protein